MEKNPTFGASFGAHLNEWSSNQHADVHQPHDTLPPDPAEAATTEAVDEVPGETTDQTKRHQPNEFHHGENKK